MKPGCAFIDGASSPSGNEIGSVRRSPVVDPGCFQVEQHGQVLHGQKVFFPVMASKKESETCSLGSYLVAKGDKATHHWNAGIHEQFYASASKAHPDVA